MNHSSIPPADKTSPEPSGEDFLHLSRPSRTAEVLAAAATYQPELWRVKKDTIYAAMPAIEAAIEHTTELLAAHDATLGRTILKNRTWAERLESDIRQMKKALALLRAEPQSRE